VQSGYLKLDWDGNQESDLAGYRIYRSPNLMGIYQQMNDDLVSTSTFIDYTSSHDKVYFYYVTAVDTHDNESGHGSPVSNGSFNYLPVVLQKMR
jgi:fibronectin type 3 domain-containing protein